MSKPIGTRVIYKMGKWETFAHWVLIVASLAAIPVTLIWLELTGGM